MKDASPIISPWTMTSISPLIRQVLHSSDGNEVYAEGVGDITKPHLVFVHGFTLCGSVFDKIFHDTKYQEEYFMVCPGLLRLYVFINYSRFDMICEVMDVAGNQTTTTAMNPNYMQTTSWQSSKHIV